MPFLGIFKHSNILQILEFQAHSSLLRRGYYEHVVVSGCRYVLLLGIPEAEKRNFFLRVLKAMPQPTRNNHRTSAEERGPALTSCGHTLSETLHNIRKAPHDMPSLLYPVGNVRQSRTVQKCCSGPKEIKNHQHFLGVLLKRKSFLLLFSYLCHRHVEKIYCFNRVFRK